MGDNEETQNRSQQILKNIRKTVESTVERVTSETKISPATRRLLAAVVLTRKGDGTPIVDVTDLIELLSEEGGWQDQVRDKVGRKIVNPTQLADYIPDVMGMPVDHYIQFVQQPLARDGRNGIHLKEDTEKQFKHYASKNLLEERTKLFGRTQKDLFAKLITRVISLNEGLSDEALAARRQEMSAADQMQLAAQAVGVSVNEVMERLLKIAIAQNNARQMIAKAKRIADHKGRLEQSLRRLGSQGASPALKTKMRSLWMAFREDMAKVPNLVRDIGTSMDPLDSKLQDSDFDKALLNFHVICAQIDAIANSWALIMTEAERTDTVTPYEKLKAMETILQS